MRAVGQGSGQRQAGGLCLQPWGRRGGPEQPEQQPKLAVGQTSQVLRAGSPAFVYTHVRTFARGADAPGRAMCLLACRVATWLLSSWQGCLYSAQTGDW